MVETLCVVCWHRPPTRGVVCDQDRERITAQLAELPRMMAALALHLVPTAVGFRTDRVATTRTGSPTTARLDVLNLAGPGTDGLSPQTVAGMLHPQVRKWRTVHRVVVTTTVGGTRRQVERDVVEWHQEMVRKPPYTPVHVARTGDRDVFHPAIRPVVGPPVLVADNDQTGLLPPAEWLDSWARMWRRRFGHATPPARRAQGAEKTPAGARIAAAAMVLAAQHRYNVQVILGLSPGHGGAPTLRAPDPLADEWMIRYGEPAADRASHSNVTYLLAWFDQASEHDLGIGDFAAELRSLTAELGRVLGEQPDEQWLGRCPARITDRVTEVARLCGAGLWQDPHASQVQCPRCRSTWGPKRVELFHLAMEIRRVWPIDRRRRYTTADANTASDAAPDCPGCGVQTEVAWRDVTATDDRERWWRPERAVCPNECVEAGRVI